jgi:predicted dithiol-disulfide oxidoreductase (DUF899 family)
MPWIAVEKAYEFEAPQGKVGLLDLFEGHRHDALLAAAFGWIRDRPSELVFSRNAARCKMETYRPH